MSTEQQIKHYMWRVTEERVQVATQAIYKTGITGEFEYVDIRVARRHAIAALEADAEVIEGVLVEVACEVNETAYKFKNQHGDDMVYASEEQFNAQWQEIP